MTTRSSTRRISFGDIGREPFRAFFPAGVFAGIVGVALWPLYFTGVLELYPGLGHARIMAYGLFGGFILGFLGTAMPRMLSTRPLPALEVILLVLVHVGMVISFALGRIVLADVLFLVLLAAFIRCVAVRFKDRKDTPPPGFMLVGLAFLSVTCGGVLSVVEHCRELDVSWTTLQRLLSYQGFVLLPILGIGPFILPRIFGMPNQHDFGESLVPPAGWWRKALVALAAGVFIIASFLLEATGWHRLAHAVRFGTTLVYLFLEMPFQLVPKTTNPLSAAIRVAFAGVLAGFLAVSLLPAYRVSLLHLTLIGGFAVIAFVVATRVVFGHSGNLTLLKGRNRWLLMAVALMNLGMAARISGDFWPEILASHYIYGALIWISGVLIWSAYVLPKVLLADTEE